MDSIEKKSFIITVWVVFLLKLSGSLLLWTAFLIMTDPALRIALLCWCAARLAFAGSSFIKGLKLFKLLSKNGTNIE